MPLSRRHFLSAAAAYSATARAGFGASATEITWDDLIPPGVPYSEIIGEGYMDERNDVWRPIFDENANKLNPKLDGAYIKMPGFIIPIEQNRKGVTEFILVPYVGACLHTPPPPPNQLVSVTAKTPWAGTDLWEAVWVIGKMTHSLQSTEVGETGYFIHADEMDVYVW